MLLGMIHNKVLLLNGSVYWALYKKRIIIIIIIIIIKLNGIELKYL